MDSLLYSSYKAIGYVTDGSNFIINRLGNEIFLTTSIGKSFQVYRFDKLSVCLVSAMAPKIIQSMAVIGLKTYVGIDHDIFIYKRTKICHKLKYHHENIMGMISIGHYLLSYDSNKNVIVSKISLIDNDAYNNYYDTNSLTSFILFVGV
jgi:U3 small nucleolar RNA-associated protein 21